VTGSDARQEVARVDAHQHFWEYDPARYGWIDASMQVLRRDYLPDDLGPLLHETGTQATVAVQATQSVDETDWLLGLADRHPFIAGVVGWVDLQADSDALYRQLARLSAHPKFVGVRHVVQDEPDDFFLRRPAFRRGLSVLAEFDLAYDILIYPRQLPAALELVAALPHQRFVLDHLGKPPIRTWSVDAWAQALEPLAALPNVCAKLSGLVTEAEWTGWTDEAIRPCLEIAWSCFGADRLMAGSDWPVCTLAASYVRTVGLVEAFLGEKTTRERAAVLGGNAQRFYRLSTAARAGAPGDRA
jgi:L-fuconolactonase